MKYKAVVFDLYGTLVPAYSPKRYNPLVSEMAEALSVPQGTLLSDKFKEMWLHDTVATACRYARRTYCSRTRLRRCDVESTATTPVGRDVLSAREKDQPA